MRALLLVALSLASASPTRASLTEGAAYQEPLLSLADTTSSEWWRSALAIRQANLDWIPGLIRTEENRAEGKSTFGYRLERGANGGISVTPAGEDANDAPADGLLFVQSLLGESPATAAFRTEPPPALGMASLAEGGRAVEIPFLLRSEGADWTGTLRIRRTDGVPISLVTQSQSTTIQVRYSGSAEGWFPVEIRWIHRDAERTSTLDAYWRP